MSDKQHIICGLVNNEGKYLTAEKFGNQINVKGTSLSAKQTWTIEPEGDGYAKCYLRSPQKQYLETTKSGTVNCENDEKQPSGLFDVTITEDGRWVFKDTFGKILVGSAEGLNTTMVSKQTEDYSWAIHNYGVYPQYNMKSISLKRYVHMEEDEFTAVEDIPWGNESVITVEFRQGKYALQDSRGRYLNGVSGKLEASVSNDSLFVRSFNGDEYSFRASNGKYLTASGPKSALIASRKNNDKETLFALEKDKAQIILTANNGKKVSIKQGIDVNANQSNEAGDSETFQVGYVNGDDVTFVAKTKKYWSAEAKSIAATADNVKPDCKFKMEWKDVKIAIKANNGKYITCSSNGHLTPNGDNSSNENALFIIELVNRQTLVLQCDHGFIGGHEKLQCNRGTYDIMHVENKNGKYCIKMADGKSWKIDDTGALITSSGEEDLFLFVLCGENKMKIKTNDGKFLTGDIKSGSITTTEDEGKAIPWEY